MPEARLKSVRIAVKHVLPVKTRVSKPTKQAKRRSPRLESSPKPNILVLPAIKIKVALKADFNSECPVCGSIISGDIIDIQEHVDNCLENGTGQSDEESVPGKFEIPDAMPTASLNVEGDESRYGRPQYTFEDVRRIVDEASSEEEQGEDSEPNFEELQEECSEKMNHYDLAYRFERLKEKMNKLPCCSLCLDHFQYPVVSVGCWHVSCELCWCRTLAAKRLCPHCNRITAPEDLRRIYM